MPMIPNSRQKEAVLLGALFAARGRHLAPPELVALSGIAADKLEQALVPYVQAGYPVEYHPQRGIGLGEPPDIWCAEEILGRCPARENLPAWEPLLLAETASTNDVVRDQARRGAREGFVVAAAQQARGRGRLGRAWESPAGLGLYVSILLRPAFPAAEAGQLTILASVAASDAVENVAGVRPRIKWPNDLFIGGRKLGGLLIESEPRGTRLDHAVIGIGINVRQGEDDFSEEVRALATSLRIATGKLFRRADVLVALLHAFEERLARPFAETREAWAESSLTLGQRVELSTARGLRRGQAIGLDESGALLLRNEAGEIETVTAGDMRAV
jgi:BirA family transcriptional regulator, biotin operon repressor / biotin---[acetyl-CoA-carboxylase] ligase